MTWAGLPPAFGAGKGSVAPLLGGKLALAGHGGSRARCAGWLGEAEGVVGRELWAARERGRRRRGPCQWLAQEVCSRPAAVLTPVHRPIRTAGTYNSSLDCSKPPLPSSPCHPLPSCAHCAMCQPSHPPVLQHSSVTRCRTMALMTATMTKTGHLSAPRANPLPRLAQAP